MGGAVTSGAIGLVRPNPVGSERSFENYEAWRDLQGVLEDRDAEWWADHDPDEEG